MASQTISTRILIIVATTDIAGMNMRPFLIDKLNLREVIEFELKTEIEGKYQLHENSYVKLLTLPHPQIHTDYLRDILVADIIIFASKHSSAAGKKTLLVHTTGLWGKAEDYGGQDYELAVVSSKFLTRGYQLLKQYQIEQQLHEYWVGIEATHHGPTSLKYPVMFIETGGTLVEWSDPAACELVSDVIVTLVQEYLNGELNDGEPAMIGFGGGHYCPAFIRKLEENEYSVGHIAPKYSHGLLTEAMIQQAWDKTQAYEKLILIDKKGTRSKERKEIIEIVEKLGLPWRYT